MKDLPDGTRRLPARRGGAGRPLVFSGEGGGAPEGNAPEGRSLAGLLIVGDVARLADLGVGRFAGVDMKMIEINHFHLDAGRTQRNGKG